MQLKNLHELGKITPMFLKEKLVCIVNHVLVPSYAISTAKIPAEVRKVVKLNSLPPPEDSLLPELFVETLVHDLCTEIGQCSDGLGSDLAAVNPLCLFGLTISFVDIHDRSFPPQLLPSATRIGGYIDAVLATRHQQSLLEQFRIALSESQSGFDAALVCLWANRIMARNMDKRAYPSLVPTASQMETFNHHLLPMPTWFDQKSEPVGDLYYFWTSFCMVLSLEEKKFRENPSLPLSGIEQAYHWGANIMALTRQYIARQKMASTHKTALFLGYTSGWSVWHNVR